VRQGGDAPPILYTTEEVFDFVPLPIEPLRTIGLFDRVATVRDDRQSPFVLGLLTRCLTVVGLVGGHDERRSRRIQDFFDDLAERSPEGWLIPKIRFVEETPKAVVPGNLDVGREHAWTRQRIF
jgi:hypothetical protein